MQKTILITGGNSGIGFATVYQLLLEGHRVIFTSRSVEKGEEALKKIKRLTESRDVFMRTIDLADFASIRQFATEFKAEYPQLDVLINNAGVYTDDFTLTKNGYELQMGVNHLGHFLLSHLLKECLEKSPSPRVVNVSSKAHYSARPIDFERFTSEKGNYKGMLAYSNAKLANILFTKEWARQYPNIPMNALHPGLVNTAFANKNAGWFISGLWHLFRLFAISPNEGAKTSVYTAISPEIEGISGEYFDECRIKKPSDLALNEEMAKLLWEKSMEYCQL